MFKIDKKRIFTVKWNELEKSKNKLNKVNGLYFYHVNGKLMYVGKAVDLWSRFGHGYLKEDSKVHKNVGLMEIIAARPNMVEVIFVPMDKADLKEQETLWIQKHIPLFNESENPRYKTLALQKVIARTVNESNRLWTFAEMREYIYTKYKKKLSYNQIDVALANKQKDLSRYCGTSQEKQLLVPKKKQRKQKE
ncbi:GIY-YIG nuclease family protein [Bacillus tropicus]|uniref:GIY-YIG nuclease family protein n=1 Tax=Bacillus tropicus TaxID=2026188 RepID=UPI00207A0051|nr:GIY-YIG nuclease family protein [Bacillus tropicus]USK98221.1 GIY-YIG nuclease family protein [Bacillus tropicus]